MAKANDLIALIKERQAQIAQWQAELDQARALLLGEGQGKQPSAKPTGTVQRLPKRPGSKRRRRQHPSSITWTDAVLREKGEPLHIKAILMRIEERFHKKVLKTTLVGNLARKVKDKDTFYRSAPSTFGLLEWKSQERKGS